MGKINVRNATGLELPTGKLRYGYGIHTPRMEASRRHLGCGGCGNLRRHASMVGSGRRFLVGRFWFDVEFVSARAGFACNLGPVICARIDFK